MACPMKNICFLLLVLMTAGPLRAQAVRTVTSSADSGAGTLRKALTATPNDDQIGFAPSLAGQTIRLSTQLLLSKSVTLDGQAAPGVTLSGENHTRILRIDYSFVAVTIRTLTFANGRAADTDPATTLRGGAIELSDPNMLRVENCRFLRNVGERSGAIFVGYGARATVLACTFNDNDGSVANDGFGAGAVELTRTGPLAALVNRPEVAAVSLRTFPNPFSGRATVAYVLAQSGPVRLELHDAVGRQLAVLLDDTMQAAGAHTCPLALTGPPLKSGIYYCVLHTAGGIYSQRVLLVR